MTTVYCVNDSKDQLVDCFTNENEAQQLAQRLSRAAANRELLASAGLPPALLTDAAGFLHFQLNHILGITEDQINAQLGQTVYYTVNAKSVQ